VSRLVSRLVNRGRQNAEGSTEGAEIDHADEIEEWGTRVGLPGYLPATPSATPITVELAEKCTALTDKAFPWRVPDDPAAGRVHGSPKQARDYYNECVVKNGSMDEQLREPEPLTRSQRKR
jgi:hypothetical protein